MIFYVIKPVLDGRGGVQYATFRVVKRNNAILRARRRAALGRHPNIILTELLDPGCMDGRLRQFANRFLAEEEFGGLMTELIVECSQSAVEAARRLERLREFIDLVDEAERWRAKGYPFVVLASGYNDWAIRKILESAPTKYYLDERWQLHLFPESFCLYHRFLLDTFFLPYDVEQVDPEVVARTGDYVRWALENTAELVAQIVAQAEERDERLEKVLAVLRYTLFLRGLLKGGGEE